MKEKIRWIVSAVSLMGMLTLSAQEKTITGTVTDQDGLPLPGVNIVVQGTTTGTQTDFDGNYAIQASVGQTLSFTYIGQLTAVRTVGAPATIDVQMEPDTQQLEEVVVTALGISREKKSLGYATTELDGDQVNVPGETNVINTLSGKAAGVQITRNNNLGGSTNVVIRGVTSINGDNQALFVLDGVPLNNSLGSLNDDLTRGRGGYDYGNPVADIDPSTIESVNILKGAAATALYGSRAANGAVIITTKRGTEKDGLGITINSGVTMGIYDKETFIEYQKEYGQGYFGERTTDTGSFVDGFRGNVDLDGNGTNDLLPRYNDDASYGPRFNPDLMVYQWDALVEDLPTFMQRSPWVAAEHDPSFLFQTSYALNNSVTFSQNNENSDFRATYTNSVQTGILPNSQIVKNSLSATAGYNLSDKWRISTNVNYANTRGEGRNGTGYDGANGRNLMTNFRQWWAVNADLEDLKRAYGLTGRNITWNWATEDAQRPEFWDNPYWTLNKNIPEDQRNRIFGNVSLDYKVTDWLTANVRLSVDHFDELREQHLAVGSVGIPFFSSYNRNFSEFNYDANLTFNKAWEGFSVTALAGLNIRRTETNIIFASTNGGLIVPDVYALSNSLNPPNPPTEVFTKVGVDGVFGSISLGYNNFLYLDLTGRQDKASTLPLADNSFFYPSVSGSFVFSNIFDRPWLSFGKLRLNYAEVGKFGEAHSLVSPVLLNPGGAFGGNNQASISATLRNPDLKPETTTSVEAGLEMAFLQNRLGFDAAVYRTNSVDQIIDVAISTATGYARKFVNSGEIENRGVEVSLFGSPIRTEDFQWDIRANWSKNKSEVLSLFQGVDNFEIGSAQTGVSFNATVGRPYGTLRGSNYVYHENGRPIVDQETGAYMKSETSEEIGDTNPDWIGGVTNSLKYRNLSLSFLIDVRQGGDVYSVDTYYGFGSGLYPETVGTNPLGNPIRDPLAAGGGYRFPGVAPDGSPNTVLADVSDAVNSGGLFGDMPQAAHVWDGSFVKLREVALTYDFPQKFVDRMNLRGLSLSLTGSNLWIIHKNMPYSDPESGFTAGNMQGIQIGAYPTTKNYGSNMKIEF